MLSLQHSEQEGKKNKGKNNLRKYFDFHSLPNLLLNFNVSICKNKLCDSSFENKLGGVFFELRNLRIPGLITGNEIEN